MSSKTVSRILPLMLLVAWATPAFAHPGHDEISTFAAGFSHPFGGIDHILAMTLVGILAAYIGGRAIWLIPASFLALMIAGGMIGTSGPATSIIEIGIWGSVITLAAIVWLRVHLALWAAASLVGFFAIFHGFAHMAEMPTNAEWLDFGAGFLAATALLHIGGLAVGLATRRPAADRQRPLAT